MPKQLYKITQFHGGVNSNSDARDIAENELSEATDIMVDEIGKIRMMGANATHGDAPANTADIEPGYGLFQFSHDRLEGETSGTAAAETGDDYLAMMDEPNRSVDIYSRVADQWIAARFNLGGTAGVKASFYLADGGLRCADGNFGANNKPKWYGYVDRWFLGNGTVGLDTGDFENGILIDGWQDASSAPEAVTVKSLAGASSVVNVTSPDGTDYVSIQMLMTSNANNYANVQSSGDAISTTVKVQTIGTFAEAGDTFTTTGSNTDWDVDNFCSVGDRLMFQSAVDNANNQTLFTVTAIDAGSPNVITFDEDVTAETDDVVQIMNLSRTAWFDTFKDGICIGVSTLYGDEKQESKMDISELEFYNIQNRASYYPDEVGFYFHVYAGDGASNGINLAYPRISGFNVYLRSGNVGNVENADGDWYLYGSIDISQGAKRVDSSTYSPWFAANAGGTCGTDTAYCIIPTRSSPTTLIRYKDSTGFDQPPFTTISNAGVKEIGVSGNGAGWKTAVVANRRAYIGNVTIRNTNNILQHFGDAILKSPVNKFDSFTLENRLEATIKDGDEIIKLEEYADRLLEFKKKKMTLINISQDIEFLEGTFMHKGVSHPAAVCKTDFGIAWVNSEGCYLYDGERVSNLLEKGGRQIIKESEWASFATDNSIIGYTPKKRQLIVLKDCTATSTGDIYLFDMVTQSWVNGNTKFTDSQIQTNFVTDWNNDLVHAHTNGTGTVVKWVDTSATSNAMVITSNDIDFGQPGQKKTVYKVIVTYKTAASGSVTSNVQVDYGVNGDNTFPYDFTVPELPAANGWQTAELVPDVLSEASNIKSFILRFTTDGTVPVGFEINDVSIVYRLKGAR